jgi:DNA sulfur modification protein DndD
MSVSLRVLGWSSEGLRCPDQEIRLTKGDKGCPKVSLIQMPNGTGKTTTLQMLRAALSGAACEWDPDRVREMRDPRKDVDTGRFRAVLDCGGKKITFEVQLDFDRGEVEYKTTYGQGQQDGFRPPPALVRFLNPRFVELFVFDGELAHHLLDSTHTRAQDAIDALFHLSLLQGVGEEFEKNWQAHARQASARDRKGFTQRQNRLQRLRGRVKELTAERDRLTAEQETLAADLKAREKAYRASLNKDLDVAARLEALEKSLRKAEDKVAALVRDSVGEMRNPHSLLTFFGTALQELKVNSTA